MKQAHSFPISTQENITCPCCFKGYEINRLLIYKQNSNETCLPKRFTVHGVPMYDDGVEVREYVCPECGFQIPLHYLKYPTLQITMVGAPDSGKTCFTLFMYHKMTELCDKYKINFSRVDLYTGDILGRMYRKLFNTNSSFTVDKTATEGELYRNHNYCQPFIFEITPKVSREDTEKLESSGGVFMNLYDQAGEDWVDLTTVNTRFLHLKTIQNVVFIFYDVAQRDFQNITPWELVTSLKQKIPYSNPKVVVIVSKLDTWYEHLVSKIRQNVKRVPREWEHFFKNPTKETNFENFESKIREISDCTRDLLETHEYCKRFLNAVDDLSHDVVFIPLSASGCPATQNDSGEMAFDKQSIHPVWVEMPILYALSQSDYCKQYFDVDNFNDLNEGESS